MCTASLFSVDKDANAADIVEKVLSFFAFFETKMVFIVYFHPFLLFLYNIV